ncbi:MAG TPA: hypothetical protein VMT16_09245 [Thermoanaerobaculia bacterium]|nr:hypothetical protein [Thermoanaerobaculia bacterium]
MFTSLRERVAVSDTALQALLAAGTLVSFGWLLLQDQIHPIFVYFLQLYLTF